MIKRLLQFALFGNYFLALCITALSLETCLKSGFFIKNVFYFLLTFLSVVVYYTHAYITDSGISSKTNVRSLWYFQNRRLVYSTQVIYTLLVAYLCIRLVVQYHSSIQKLSLSGWLGLLIFPLAALLYYGAVFPALFRFRLRNIAWLKPFLIGFVCTGSIVIYPMVFSAIESGTVLQLTLANACYFLTNWLFTTAIAIMFDIKDFAADHNYHLKTFVVTKGLRYTIFNILLPLSAASFVSFLFFAVLNHFSFLRIAINIIPFVLLLYAPVSFRRRRGILYYLVVIDGLLMVKALFGIFTMTLIK